MEARPGSADCTQSSAASVPVIVLTAKELDAQTIAFLQRDVMGQPGACQVLRKSFDVSELLQAIQEFCAFEPAPAAAVR